MFRTLKTADPRTVTEQAAYDKWLDRNADREVARQDRIHEAVDRFGAAVVRAARW
jgi:hypothetical protein